MLTLYIKWPVCIRCRSIYRSPRYSSLCVWQGSYGNFPPTACSITKHNEDGYKWQPATSGTCDKSHLNFDTHNTNVARLLTVRLLLTWSSSKCHPLTGGQYLYKKYSYVTSLRILWVLNPLTPELNSSAQRCLTRFFTGDFASWTVHFVNICVKN
jgi:hypothetical protein